MILSTCCCVKKNAGLSSDFAILAKLLPLSDAGLSHMTELSRTLMRGLVQSLSRSSLRTQGPITPGRRSEKRPLLKCRSESPRRMDPCVRRDDSLENSICDSLAFRRVHRVAARGMSVQGQTEKNSE